MLLQTLMETMGKKYPFHTYEVERLDERQQPNSGALHSLQPFRKKMKHGPPGTVAGTGQSRMRHLPF